MRYAFFTTGLLASLISSTSLSRAAYVPTRGDNSAYYISTIQSSGDLGSFSFSSVDANGDISVATYYYGIREGITSNERVNSDQDGADINGNFFNLSSNNTGGAIDNSSTLFAEWGIGNINADFVNNRTTGGFAVSHTRGGAIDNYSDIAGRTSAITSITGDFIGNSASSDRPAGFVFGGAISNSTGIGSANASIGNITGNFINNSAISSDYQAYGGAIYNSGGWSGGDVSLGTISGSFIGNSAIGDEEALGGAIYSSSSLMIASNGKVIEFSGNYIQDTDGTTNNAIFLDSHNDSSIALNFDVSQGGQILFYDEIDGGNVENDGSNIDYSQKYALVISGNGTTSNSGSVLFADTIHNASAVTVNNATMTMGSYDGHHGNFAQQEGGTADITLNSGHLDLDFDDYQTLTINSLTATGSSFLSFGANFHEGTADQLNVATVSGDFGLREIHMDNFGNIGDSVTVFADTGASVTFNNLDTYTGIYNNIDYKFEQDGSTLKVVFKDLVRAESVVVEEEILDVSNKVLNNLTGGILDNSGATTVTTGSFSGNSNNNGNGGVFSNHGSLTLTDVNFADNSSAENGGAVYNDGNLVLLSGSSYSGNSAATAGGAIYNAANGSIGAIDGLSAADSFDGNRAGSFGGAIYNDGSITSVNGFSFTNNTVSGGQLALGGAVYTSANMTFDSDGKYISFAGNSTQNAAGETTNNAIFVNTANGSPVLTFDAAEGGQILMEDEIDGGAVSADGTSVNYDGNKYSIVINGNGTGEDSASIVFADTINNASLITANNANLVLDSVDDHYGNFGSSATSLTLNDSHLDLDYAANDYHSLNIGSLTANGTLYLSFGANFHEGTSDSLNIADVSGGLFLYNIRFDNFGNVGDTITLFDGQAVTINNLDNFSKVYNNLGYTFTQNGTDLVIASKYIEWAGAVVAEEEVLDIQETHMDANSEEYEEDKLYGYILKNNGTTTVTDSSFSNIVNNKTGEEENGGVFINNGSMTITNTDFTNNSSAGKGGAIYSTSDLTLIADNDEVVFDGNADGNGGNDIYMGSGTTLYIISINDGKATFGSGINGDDSYNIDISGDINSSVAFNAAVENAASVTVKNTSLVMGGNGSFGAGSTNLSLTNGRLELDYDNYTGLALNSLTATGDSYISFGADFHAGTSDSLNIASATGELGVYNIRLDNFGNVGDGIDLFSNAYVTLNNLNSYTATYNNLDYTFRQEGGRLIVASKDLVRAESVVESGETLEVDNKDMNGLTGGILENNGTTTIDDSRFNNNQNDDGNGGVINNNGSMTITNTDFTDNTSGGNGGAIYSASDLTLVADNDDVVFDGNADSNGGNDIYMGAGTKLNIIAVNNGKASFGSGINGDDSYDIDISGDANSSVVFTAAIENAASVAVSDTVLTLADGTDGYGNFGSGSTSLSLNNGRLELDYDEYRSLAINNLTATGDSYISFGANFNQGTSDSLDIASATGELGIYNIRFGSFGNVGDTITLFDDQVVTISNLDKYTKVYNNIDYKFAQNGGELEIISKDLVRAESVVLEDEILDVQDTVLNGMTSGILDNSGTTLIEGSSFDGNSHSGNGSVVNNKGTLVITNTDFTNNVSAGNGGAIHNTGNLTLIAKNDNMLFEGNQDGSGSNDIYMAGGTTLNIQLSQNGSLSFGSGVNGDAGYIINVNGDGTGTLVLDSSIVNSASVNVSNATVKLAEDNLLDQQALALTNGTLDLANGTIGSLSLAGYSAKNAALMLDVDTEKNVSDVLNISGELTGTTGLIVNMLSSIRQSEDIVFAYTPDDTDSSDGSFVISRIVGQPYQYNLSVAYDETAKKWLFPYQEYTPDPDGAVDVAPEFVAYAGLPAAAIEQSRELSRIVAGKTAANKLFSGYCGGAYDEAYDGKNLNNAWVHVDYRMVSYDKPVDTDADIWGITGGFDVQSDARNKLGVFAAYRQGDYDLSGKGGKYRSTLGSNIDIDSYLAGIYYRYDHNRWHLFADIHGGIQKAEAETDDKVIKTDTDGVEYGASIMAGYTYSLGKDLTVEPSLGVFYTSVDYDDIRDAAQNRIEYDTLYYAEAEAGVKLEKTFVADESIAKLYVMPSVIQTFGSGDALMSGLGTVDGLKNRTLGRLEIGGRYGFSSALSAFAWGNYTFGSSYDAATFGLGLSYSW